MSRFFNTEGPCDARRHYMVPPEGRFPELEQLVERDRYFILHAPRQSGKTTTMDAFAARLRGRGIVALRASLLGARAMPEIERSEPIWLDAIQAAAEAAQLPAEQMPPDYEAFRGGAPGTRLGLYLRAWSGALPCPLVLFLDEADAVQGEAMASLLAQLRNGYERRLDGQFPRSVALIGLRDLRDYLIEVRGRPFAQTSPFNITTSHTLRPFTGDQVRALYAQHTADTGQPFTEEAIDCAYTWTNGQPYLVNALAQTCVDRLVRDRALPIVPEHIEAAKEELIGARVTHLDNLTERMREERVARVVTAILLGTPGHEVDPTSDDFKYCVDLGLIRTEPRVEAANPWYREVIARQLAAQRPPDVPERPWVVDGRLDVPALVDGFFAWWRRHADALRERDTTPYREAVPHIVFLSWLQKIVNGGGRTEREFALGRERMDVVVEFAGERHVFELKRVRPRDALSTVKEAAVEQTSRYLDTLGLREAWILIFDERELSWDEKLWREDREVGGRILHLRGG